MTTTTFISIVITILGAIALALFFSRRFKRYDIVLVVGALLMFAISIAIYLAGQPADTPSEPLAAQTSTPTSEERQPPISPILPVSPVSTPGSALIEKEASAELEGCLLFVSNRSGDFEIYKSQGNLNTPQPLTNSPGLDIEPTWSADGTKIAFASNREENAGFQIYVMNADGSNQARVGEIQPGDNSHPSWSADGEQLVFQSKRDTNANLQDDNLDIYKMNSDASNHSILAAHPADDSEPSWSPDGRRIAFLSERSGQDEIYLMDPDGANLEQVTELPVLKSGLSWSDDSRTLIFEGSGDIYRVDVETKQVAKLIAIKDTNEATPAWAGNDKFVVFSSDRSQNWELYAVDVSNPDQLILYQITDDPGIDRSPTWFPCTSE